MAVGYNPAERFVSRTSHTGLHSRLDEVLARRHDHNWLRDHAEDIYHLIRQSLLRNGDLPQKASRILLDISPYMLTRINPPERWWTLYVDALLEAGNRRDYVTMHEVYALLGQALLMRGDTDRARHLFTTIIHDVGELMTQPEWSTDEWTRAEQALLAYIGSIKVRMWDDSDVLDEDIIPSALDLAHRLNDGLLTILLYQTLASNYAYCEQYDLAIGYGQTALAYALRRGDRLQGVMIIGTLTWAYRRARAIGPAESVLAFAEQLNSQADYPEARALISYERGCLQFDCGAFHAAQQNMRRARSLFRAVRWSYFEALSTHLLGKIALALENYSAAERRLLDALNQLHASKRLYEQINVLYSLADVYQMSGRPHLARQRLNEAAATCAYLPPTPGRSDMLKLIGERRAVLEH